MLVEHVGKKQDGCVSFFWMKYKLFSSVMLANAMNYSSYIEEMQVHAVVSMNEDGEENGRLCRHPTLNFPYSLFFTEHL